MSNNPNGSGGSIPSQTSKNDSKIKIIPARIRHYCDKIRRDNLYDESTYYKLQWDYSLRHKKPTLSPFINPDLPQQTRLPSFDILSDFGKEECGGSGGSGIPHYLNLTSTSSQDMTSSSQKTNLFINNLNSKSVNNFDEIEKNRVIFHSHNWNWNGVLNE